MSKHNRERRNRSDAGHITTSRGESLEPEYEGPLVGLKGEVFTSDGRIAGAMPPIGMPDSIRFEIFGEYPGQEPPWADMQLEVRGRIVKCRINPDICQPPYFRLWDCVKSAADGCDVFPPTESGTMAMRWLPPQPHAASQRFVFCRAFMGQIVLIDTYERAAQYCHIC